MSFQKGSLKPTYNSRVNHQIIWQNREVHSKKQNTMDENKDPRATTAWAQTWALPLTSCAAMGKMLNFSVHQFFYA